MKDSVEIECRAYCESINTILHRSRHRGEYLPLTPENMFERLRDGIVLSEFLNEISPGSVDIQKMIKNVKIQITSSGTITGKSIKDVYEVRENLHKFFSAMKKTHIVIVNIGEDDVLTMNRTLVLGLVWQMIRGYLSTKINSEQNREVVSSLVSEKDGVSVMKEEEILIRWVNRNLEGTELAVRNLSGDFSDSRVVLCLLERLFPHLVKQEEVCSVLAGGYSEEARAEKTLELVGRVSQVDFITPAALVSGNEKIIFTLVVFLFDRANSGETRRKSESEIEEERQQKIDGEAAIAATSVLRDELFQKREEVERLQTKVAEREKMLEEEKRRREDAIDQIKKEFAWKLQQEEEKNKKKYREMLIERQRSIGKKKNEDFEETLQRIAEELKEVFDDLEESEKIKFADMDYVTQRKENRHTALDVKTDGRERITQNIDSIREKGREFLQIIEIMYDELERHDEIEEVMREKVRGYAESMVESSNKNKKSWWKKIWAKKKATKSQPGV
ncbi:MAG: fimbrin-like protein [Amphiamblys sp. WSBS2006]|nr:MAG: fimbrin-like protein [Amphiamblys sp. WSBS2006]